MLIQNLKKYLIIGNLILFSSLSMAQVGTNIVNNDAEPIEVLNQKIMTLENDRSIIQNSISNLERIITDQKRAQDAAAVEATQKIEASKKEVTEEQGTISKNINYTWILICATLVFFMQAGFALIESGASRSKNMVNVLMKNYMDMAVGAIAFSLVGYGLMFGTNLNGLVGLSHFGLHDFTNDDYMFFFFQLMFAATAATIVSGALAERTRFTGYLIGAIFICAFIYPIFGSWSWGSYYQGSGWLKDLGFIDFAGSSVVHALGGFAALAAAMVVGPRLGRFGKNGQVFDIPGHNAALMALGTFILWFGWFGFNGGSLLEANDSLGMILLNTHLAACSGALGAMFIQQMNKEKILMTMVLNGGLGGLVGITAGAASIDPLFAVVTGFIAGIVMYLSTKLLLKFKIDDVVGAFPVHGACGVWGTIAAGVFLKGDMFNLSIISVQFIGVFACIAWAFIASYIVYSMLNLFGLLRVPAEDERAGLDYTEHAELGYPEFQKDILFNKQQQ